MIIGVIKEIVGLFHTKFRATVIVVLISVIVYLYVENQGLYNKRLQDKNLQAEIERRIYLQIIAKYDPAFEQIKRTTDSSKAVVDSTSQLIEPVIKKLSETIKNIK